MILLLESALRSLLLGLLVWALLKLLRMRDTGTETLIWTFVLIVALSMPLLSHYLPGLLVTLPRLPAPTSPQQTATSGHPAAQLAWLAGHGSLVLLSIYLAGLTACLARLSTGLLLTLRLYRRALPVQAAWARGRRIRASATLRSPASLANTILLPANFTTWGPAKLEAVLAHEDAHIARHDFFVQLAASVHCALFWFSPFAWWLQAKLAEIAESASDDAAVQHLNDPFKYAEILVDVARCAHRAQVIMAMAKGPLIHRRVDRILCATSNRNLSGTMRALVVAALTLVALTLATARAGVDKDPGSVPDLPLTYVKAAKGILPRAPSRKLAVARRRQVPAPLAAPPRQVARGVDEAAITQTASYNPRALLTPVYVASRDYVPASTIIHEGRTFYIRSTERPVAEVAITAGAVTHDK